ncbi:hypothetical protein IZ6_02760 [Terrihabitans soli]|uniref:PepSY domain-containing protein n=2 Tax=Terrihabitans soli TaxID=708113 RepID=A0A6S6QR73_9HYPH|nr:hypothetical protein IZ6_02760 [Terrihabitans soli]
MIRKTVLGATALAVLVTGLASAPALAGGGGKDYAARQAKKWEHLHLNAYRNGNSGIFSYDEECRTIRVKAWDDYYGYVWTKKVVCG